MKAKMKSWRLRGWKKCSGLVEIFLSVVFNPRHNKDEWASSNEIVDVSAFMTVTMRKLLVKFLKDFFLLGFKGNSLTPRRENEFVGQCFGWDCQSSDEGLPSGQGIDSERCSKKWMLPGFQIGQFLYLRCLLHWLLQQGWFLYNRHLGLECDDTQYNPCWWWCFQESKHAELIPFWFCQNPSTCNFSRGSKTDAGVIAIYKEPRKI